MNPSSPEISGIPEKKLPSVPLVESMPEGKKTLCKKTKKAPARLYFIPW